MGRFELQLMEMCAAMCVGGIILGLVFFEGAALIGYPNFVEQNFLVSVLVGHQLGIWRWESI